MHLARLITTIAGIDVVVGKRIALTIGVHTMDDARIMVRHGVSVECRLVRGDGGRLEQGGSVECGRELGDYGVPSEVGACCEGAGVAGEYICCAWLGEEFGIIRSLTCCARGDARDWENELIVR